MAVIAIRNGIFYQVPCIKTSCTPIGCTNEAPGDAHNRFFPLWVTYGPPSLFLHFPHVMNIALECNYMPLMRPQVYLLFVNMKKFCQEI
jgi:hypothetical protein